MKRDTTLTINETDQNASLNYEIERKMDKKQVLCFLKEYDRSFETRFERTFPVVALYAEDKVDSGKTQEVSNLVADTDVPVLQDSPSSSAENEKQPFSPSTKTVIKEIATTINMDHRTLLPSAVVKRGIIFNEDSATTENVLLCEKAPSGTHKTVAAASGSESPVKKLKNVASGD